MIATGFRPRTRVMMRVGRAIVEGTVIRMNQDRTVMVDWDVPAGRERNIRLEKGCDLFVIEEASR